MAFTQDNVARHARLYKLGLTFSLTPTLNDTELPVVLGDRI